MKKGNKARMSSMPVASILRLTKAFSEGRRKHGGDLGWRTEGRKASECFDAIMRHAFAWWEGEDYDDDGEMLDVLLCKHHIEAVASTALILLDAIETCSLYDDRPTTSQPGWLRRLNEELDRMEQKHGQDA